MADPTDLIREADAALTREAANEGGPIVDDPADLVRRLRDALATALDDNRTLADATIAALHAQVEHEGHQADVEMFKAVEANAELVKAQETIERVRALADEWGAGIGGTVAALALRRAIEGPPQHTSTCPECGNLPDGGHLSSCDTGAVYEGPQS